MFLLQLLIGTKKKLATEHLLIRLWLTTINKSVVVVSNLINLFLCVEALRLCAI